MSPIIGDSMICSGETIGDIVDGIRIKDGDGISEVKAIMIFSAFSKPKCVICKRKFHSVEEVKSNDQEALEDALSLGQFGCDSCKIKFHGMCGKIGQANPQSAIVTCPKCRKRIKHQLPFTVVVVKKESTNDQVGDRIDKDYSNRDI